MRLVKGLANIFPGDEVTFKPNAGFKKVLQELCAEFISSKCFLFRGTPNILINHQSAVVASMGEEEDMEPHNKSSDSDDGKVENSFQRPPLGGNNPFSLPEKTGELVASLHFVLVSNILSNISIPVKCKPKDSPGYQDQMI